jgi:hypothetical protein
MIYMSEFHFEDNYVLTDILKRLYTFLHYTYLRRVEKSHVWTNEISEKRQRIQIIQNIFTVFQYPHIIEATR